MLDRKKIISIIIILLVAAILGFLMYLAFFRQPAPALPPDDLEDLGPGGLPGVGPATEPGRVGEEGDLPEVSDIPEEDPGIVPDSVAAGGITSVKALSSDEAQNPTLLSSGSLAYYDDYESKFYKISPTGKVTELSDKEFYNVQNINWSPAADRAILEYPDGSKLAYDFKTNRQYTLPKEWEDFSFNSSGNQIAFKHLADIEENRWLATANFDGSGIELIEPLGQNADKVQVNFSPTSQIVANHWKSVNSNIEEIFFVGQYGENFKSLTVTGRGFKASWTPDGEKLVYSTYDAGQGYIPTLSLVNASGDAIGTNQKDLGVNTWIDKCAISSGSDYAYCAVPQEMPQGAGLLPELTYDIPDDFYRINLRTGQKELLAKPYGDYTADQVIISSDEGKLYFRDINTGRLHEIRLK